MANDLGYTPGSGSSIATVQASSDGAHVQLVALSAIGATGDRSPIPSDFTKGLGVQVLAIGNTVTFPVVNPSGQKLAVDGSGVNQPVVNASGQTIAVSAAANAPVAVRLSSGSAFVDTIPVNLTNSSVTVAGTVGISGTVAATQSGTWNIATLTSITNPVTVAGTVAISGSVTVAGTVTANQGTAAALGSAWPVKLTDGTSSVGVQTISSKVGVNVAVIGGTGLGYSQQDKTNFTEGTTPVEVIGGVYNDAFAGSPSSGQASVVRITAQRAFHINIRRNDGTELATSSAPLRVDPTGTTTQPVSGTVTADQGGAPWTMNVTQIGGSAISSAAAGVQKVGVSDASGNAFSDANPLSVALAPRTAGKWRVHLTIATAQTNAAVHTPAGGTKFYIEGWILTINTSDVFVMSDGNQSDTTNFYKGQPTSGTIVCNYAKPEASSTTNNVLRYSTGASTAGDLTIWGYDA